MLREKQHPDNINIKKPSILPKSDYILEQIERYRYSTEDCTALVSRIESLLKYVNDQHDNLYASLPNPFPDYIGQIIIIAGGCEDETYSQMDDYQKIVLNAFDEYDGIIVSGGTVSGVAQIA